MATIYYTASSLDGFLATHDDDIGWLDLLPQPAKDTYTPFIAGVGAIAMGRATFEFLVAHVAAGNAWPYPDLPVWVFTNRAAAAPKGADIRFVRGDIRPAHQAMASKAGGKNIWIAGGGDLAAQFLQAGLLDELVVTVAAQTLGEGKPLLPVSAALRITSVLPLGEGFVELRLVPQRPPR